MSIDVPNYRILEKIGTGAGSTIYKAKSVATGAVYAIKHVKMHTPEDKRLIDQVRDEHACCSTLDHPALRRTFDLHMVTRRLRTKAAILFMEYVDGDTLSDCAKRYSLPELLVLMEKAADGLAAMHRAGFVHADLKPGNILVMPDDEVKLIDFGQSSRILQAKTRIQGTIDYMAPEQAARQPLDARTDVFGLGATLHRVLTGKAVATEMNQNVDLHSLGRVGMKVADNQDSALECIPAVVARLIHDCCQHDPLKRPKDMKEFVERSRMARASLARRRPAKKAPAKKHAPSKKAGET